MKKILYIHHGRGIGGAPMSLLYTIQGLDRKKYGPKVVFINPGEHIDLFRKAKIPYRMETGYLDLAHNDVSSYPLWTPHFWVRLFWQPFSYLVARRILLEEKPDIVHLNDTTLFSFARAAKDLGVPVVMHIREPLKKGLFGVRRRLLRNSIQKNTDAVIAICQNDANSLIPDQKISVVYNFVDFKKFDVKLRGSSKAKQFAKENGLEGKTVVTLLGGYSKLKGTHLFAEALKEVAAKHHEVLFAVAGVKKFSLFNKYERKIARFLRKNNLEPKWRYLGVLPSTELLLASTDILVFPAIRGHFARPIIEGYAMKVPAIGSELGGVEELIIDGKTGLFFEPGNAGDFADTLLELLSDDRLRKSRGEEGYRLAREQFEQGKNVAKIMRVYERVVRERKQRYERNI